MSEMPAWGTPPSSGSLQPEPGSSRYYLIVEQLTGGGESAVWRVEPAPISAGATREQAREAALRLARTFQPRHPFSPRRRTMFRVNEDMLVVLVEGATKTFHFRVNVTEFIG